MNVHTHTRTHAHTHINIVKRQPPIDVRRPEILWLSPKKPSITHSAASLQQSTLYKQAAVSVMMSGLRRPRGGASPRLLPLNFLGGLLRSPASGWTTQRSSTKLWIKTHNSTCIVLVTEHIISSAGSNRLALLRGEGEAGLQVMMHITNAINQLVNDVTSSFDNK